MMFLIVAVYSCHDREQLTLADREQQEISETYVPEWAPPMGPDILYYNASKTDLQQETRAQQGGEDAQIEITIKRDTIRGIAVRVPGNISIAPFTPDVKGRNQVENAFFDLAYISTNRYLGINFDNDIFNNTDYYYTNGIRIDYISPIFASSPFAYPMLPYNKLSMNYHGITIVQNMYTPTNPDTSLLLVGDRPFAAYLYLGHFKNTLVSEKRYRQYSEIQIGLIGPGSLGGFVQDQIHDIPPTGWENQIQNDIVLNYTAEFEKGIYNPEIFDLNMFARGQLGTLYTNAGAGLRIRLGLFNPYFEMPWMAGERSIEGKASKKWQYGIFATGFVKGVLYDATLEGGVFNNTSNYTIAASDIERLVLQASAGVFFAYRQFGLMYEQFYITPEFSGALHHRWGHINLTYCF